MSFFYLSIIGVYDILGNKKKKAFGGDRRACIGKGLPRWETNLGRHKNINLYSNHRAIGESYLIFMTVYELKYLI